MRHLVKGKKLGRKDGHRKQTLRSLSIALINEHRIVTTVTKAKAMRSYFEPLVTRAKDDTQHNRRQVYSKLQNNSAVSELFEEIGPMVKDRPGGYTRVLKLGNRPGDGAEMAVIELVDYNDIKPEEPKKARKRTRRAGRSKKTTPATPSPSEEKKAQEQEVQAEVEEKSVEAEEAAAKPDVEEATKEVAEEAEDESSVEEETDEASEEESSDEDEKSDNK